MTKLLSIIIPVYNAQNTLRRALDSVLNQVSKTEQDVIELLIIENGSTDGSAQIINAYREKYSCVKLLHSEKGVSKARNLGLNTAVGEWIVFLDADDFLLPNALDVIFEDIGENNDICFYSYEKYQKKHVVFASQSNESFSVVENNSQFYNKCNDIVANPTSFLQVWGKVFKRDMIKKYRLNFDEQLHFSEDSDFTLRYLSKSEQIKFSKAIIYHYASNPSSTMRVYNGEKVSEYIKAMEITYQNLLVTRFDKRAISKYILIHFNIMMVRECFAVENQVSVKQKKKMMKSCLHQSVFLNAFNDISFRDCLSLKFLPFLLMKCHLYFLAGLMYRLRVKQNRSLEGLK